ncbi:antibiotic biosynthesis monooxygenase [Roseibium sp. HPY-6]|uniref:putative quinol monooxygenase n=1 Tax=Roseibium sp. HPY-6 TaxID=3229852 RepID=UPI00338DA187
MVAQSNERGPILRLFKVKSKRGCEETLLGKFATTSANVVRNEPGNEGYFFGRGIESDEDTLVFASLWKDFDAIKQRFGDAWDQSFLPEGYEDLIEEHSLQHIDLSSGWHASVGRSGLND